jgi:hypothetical protein
VRHSVCGSTKVLDECRDESSGIMEGSGMVVVQVQVQRATCGVGKACCKMCGVHEARVSLAVSRKRPGLDIVRSKRGYVRLTASKSPEDVKL